MKFSEIVELFKNRKIEVDLNNTFKETIGLDFKLSFINELDNYLKEYFIQAALLANKNRIRESKNLYSRILEKYAIYIKNLSDSIIITLNNENPTCLSNTSNNWRECDDEELFEYDENKRKINYDLIEKGVAIKGIEDGANFKLFELDNLKIGSDDKRDLSRGRTCTTYNKLDLIRIMLQNNIIHSRSTKNKKDYYIDKIKILSGKRGFTELYDIVKQYTGKNLEELPLRNISSIEYVLTASKSNVCRMIKQILRERGLLEIK